MSTLSTLQEQGLDTELEGHFLNFFTDKAGDETRKKLTDSIDSNGLKAPAVMKLIGSLQREGQLKPGLYKELVELNKKVGSSSNGEAAVDSDSDSHVGRPDTPQEFTATSPQQEGESDASFSERQEAEVEKRLARHREKMQQRLLKEEARIRERIAKRNEKRAQRLGMKVEEAKEITEAKEKINSLRAEIKAKREEVKTLQARIKDLRPTRKRKVKQSEDTAKGKVEAKSKS